jgi:MFS family permease
VIGTRSRLTATLFGGVALASTGYLAAVTVSTLAARAITGSARLAGLPGAVAVVGTAIASTALSADIPRAGRRRGLVFGYLMAAIGGAIAVAGVRIGSFPWLLAGLFLLGWGQASSQLSRYAAADLAVVERRAGVVSLIVWAATIGAIAGPSLIEAAQTFVDSRGGAAYEGGFLVAAVFMCAALATYLLGLRPDPSSLVGTGSGGHEIDRIDPAQGWRDGDVRLALVSMIFGQVVMVLIMTGTPIHVEDGGHGLGAIGLILSVHAFGMFGLSPLSGRLVDGVGPHKVLYGSVAVMGVASLVSAMAPEHSIATLTAGLGLLGVGWNLGFVAASALLAAAAGSKVQGVVDSAVWLSSAASGLAAGVMLDLVGYRQLSVLGLVLLAVPAAALVWRHRLVPVIET